MAATPTSAAPHQLLPNQTPSSVNLELFRIGFITPPFKDNKIPVTDHLHAHAYILPADLMGWWRRVAYSSLAWYDIDDLIAEIRCVISPVARSFKIKDLIVANTHCISLREETTNNRVRSGPSTHNHPRPIDHVPSAGARRGLPNGVETTDSGLAIEDIEDPESQPYRQSQRRSTHLSSSRPQSPLSPTGRRGTTSPHLTVDVARGNGSSVSYVGAGGGLVLSPKTVSDDGLRTPTRTGSTFSLNSPIPELRV